MDHFICHRGFLGTDKTRLDAAMLEPKWWLRLRHRSCHMHPHVPFTASFTRRLRPVVQAAAAQFGIGVGSVIECLMARHGDGDAMGFHRDGVKRAFPHRILSFVYYRRFGDYTGGILQRMIDDKLVDYEPEDDALVIFDSQIIHGVTPVVSANRANWVDARFSLVGWVAPPSFVVPNPVHYGVSDGEYVTQWGPRGSFFYEPT